MSSDYLKETITTSIAASEPKTILVIEDDAAFLNVLRISFRRKGYRVLTATDVSEAEEIWAMGRSKIDVVLSDNVLGYDLGSELVQRLQKQKPNIQFVLCSGEPLPVDLERVTLLSKPFTVDAVPLSRASQF